MIRTLAVLMLMTPAAGAAQAALEIVPGQSIAGALEARDPLKAGRPYDDFQYSAVPGTQLRAIARSSTMTVDVTVYFYDEYFDLLSLASGGLEPESEVDFTVPDAGSPTVIVIRVSTMADDPGPATGAYTIELVQREDP